MIPKERIFVKGDVMTKYQVAQFKRAIKREISKESLSPRAKTHKMAKGFGPTEESRFLPDYITKNPWY